MMVRDKSTSNPAPKFYKDGITLPGTDNANLITENETGSYVRYVLENQGAR